MKEDAMGYRTVRHRDFTRGLRLNEFQPHHLSGYPSVVGLLAGEQEAGRLRVTPEAVFTNSEPLTPELRERLERRITAPCRPAKWARGCW
jgi:phenylacetate-coenzyme A ligase PaaK-like adenylate-forming protein